MDIVLLTALGVGGSTVFGAVLGFVFKKISHRFNDIILGFAAGVMLAAAVVGLILPSIEYGRDWGIPVAIVGIFCGAITLKLIDRFVPHLHKLAGIEDETHPGVNEKLNKVLLFVMAIAIHNFPEGIAAGVGFGTGEVTQALTIASGIALQNIPEGMVIIAPMIASGMSPKRTFVYALITGLVEVIGTFIGYFAVNASSAILPFALAFAGGTMIYVIGDEMIPETHSHGSETGATFALIAGFCLMLALDHYI